MGTDLLVPGSLHWEVGNALSGRGCQPLQRKLRRIITRRDVGRQRVSDTHPTGGGVLSKLSPADVASLKEHAERDAPIILAGDWEAAAARYEADAVRMPPGAPAVHGRPAILASFEAMPPLEDFTFRMEALDGDGQIAFMHAVWSVAVRPEGVPEPITDAGKILVVFRKQPDGTWLRVADAWNSNG